MRGTEVADAATRNCGGEFLSPDVDGIRSALKQPVIFDGHRLFDPSPSREMGVEYYSIERGAQPAAQA